MQSKEKFSLLRSILKTLGLLSEAADDIVERILDFLTFTDEKSRNQIEYPNHTRDDFLSPAEHSFFLVLIILFLIILSSAQTTPNAAAHEIMNPDWQKIFIISFHIQNPA